VTWPTQPMYPTLTTFSITRVGYSVVYKRQGGTELGYAGQERIGQSSVEKAYSGGKEQSILD